MISGISGKQAFSPILLSLSTEWYQFSSHSPW